MTDATEADRPRSGTSIEECVFQSVILAVDHLLRGEIEVLRGGGPYVPAVQRLANSAGAQPEALSCSTISQRMLTRDSDLTRLLDRLEERGFVRRVRDSRDRRMVTSAITDAGLQLLRRLDGPIDRVHREQLRHIPRKQLETLRALAGTVIFLRVIFLARKLLASFDGLLTCCGSPSARSSWLMDCSRCGADIAEHRRVLRRTRLSGVDGL